ncbi:Xyloglucanase [Paramyrothecium foliicola]|nr:Xyloglucanase [Paramyrothecium foliicola]
MPMKFLSLLLAAVAPVSAATWTNAKLGGGGGFVSGFVFHPKVKGVGYARTDIGGLYRLNSDDSWTAVTDEIADPANWIDRGRWGIDTFALDPQDANVVYAAVGMYTNSWDPNNGSIMKSTDRGATWSFSNLPFKVGGNMPGRGVGERLAVDPKNSNIVYFGARSGNGLWKSTDAGKTFKKVPSFTNGGTYIPDPSDAGGYNGDIHGLAFITFDETSTLSSGATSRIFVGTADNITASVYVSEDAGSTWNPVKGQPGRYFPHRAKLEPTEKALYISYADGTGPYDGTKGAVWRYDIAAATWKDITPVTGDDLTFGFGGLALDAQKPGTIVVASLNSWWPDAQLFRSTDSGATWSRLWEWNGYPNMNRYYQMDVSKAPWIKTDWLDRDSKWLGWMIESLEIDPHDSNHWLYGTGLTVYGGHDLTNWGTGKNVTVQSLADGIEEYAVLDVKSAPKGSELLAAVGDVSGFTFRDAASLTKAPQQIWNNPIFGSTNGVDYAGNKPDSVVRVGYHDGGQTVAVSYDGGVKWNAYPGADATKNAGSVSYSADADTIVWTPSSGPVVRSVNSGSFSAIASLPNGAQVVSDKRSNKHFYAASGAGFYVSTDAGLTFAKAGGTFDAATSIRDVNVHPAAAGEVYVSTDVGLFRSTDSGATFTKVPGLTNTYQVSLGVGNAGWNLYAFGSGSAGAKLYGSADLGASWTNIQGDKQNFGAIDSARLSGSGNVAGLVYVGTNGRGVLTTKVSLSGGAGPSSSSTRSVPSSTTSRTTLSTSTVSRTSSSSAIITSTSTTSTKTSSAAQPSATALAGPWTQCGGRDWKGPTQCVAGWTCKAQNEWYSQCLQ